MANSDSPRGLRPVNALGQAYTGKVNTYYKAAGDSQAMFVGDLVTLTGTAHTDEESTPIIEQADVGDVSVGVMVSILPDNPDNLGQIFSSASTGQYIMVADDPDQYFAIQEDSDSGALAVTATGQNVDIIVGTGSSVTGLSAMEIDSSTAIAATAQLRLHRIFPRINNVLGTNAEWLVQINEHRYKQTAGV